MYLGYPNGTAPFVAGVIENNFIVDTIGYNIEIKYQTPYSLMSGMPAGQRRTIIRDNVFMKRRSQSSWPSSNLSGPRPTLLVGGFPGSGRFVLHDNIFVADGGTAMVLQNHDLPLKLAHVYNNTVFGTSNGIRFNSSAQQEDAVVGNLIFPSDPVGGSYTSGNLRDNITIASANELLSSRKRVGRTPDQVLTRREDPEDRPLDPDQPHERHQGEHDYEQTAPRVDEQHRDKRHDEDLRHGFPGAPCIVGVECGIRRDRDPDPDRKEQKQFPRPGNPDLIHVNGHAHERRHRCHHRERKEVSQPPSVPMRVHDADPHEDDQAGKRIANGVDNSDTENDQDEQITHVGLRAHAAGDVGEAARPGRNRVDAAPHNP